MKKILFLGPGFLDYDNSIFNVLVNDLKLKVDYFGLRPSGLRYDILRKMSDKQFSKVIMKYHCEILDRIKNKIFDVVFIIQVHQISRDILKKYKNQYPTSTFILYYWDSIKTHDYSSYIYLFDKIYSFDYNDCIANDKIEYLPLFYREEFIPINNNSYSSIKYDVLFIGSINNIQRYHSLIKIKRWAKDNNLQYYFYAYVGFYRLDLMSEMFKDFSFIKFRVIKNNKVIKLLASSKVVIDIKNNIQSGLPIRVFEALSMRKKIITDNVYIQKEKIYNDNNIFILKNNVYPDVEFIKSQFNEDYSINLYSLKNWLNTILTL